MKHFKVITRLEELPKDIVENEEVGIIDLKTGELTVKNEVAFKCHSTTACCRLHTIPLTEEDVLRIESHGYDLYQFLEETSPVLIMSKIRRGHYTKAYILKKKPFSNECVFLEENKCIIHDFKPIACRLYPFSIRRDDGNDDKVTVIIHPESVCTSVKMCSKKEYSEKFEEEKEEIMDSKSILAFIYDIIKKNEIQTIE